MTEQVEQLICNKFCIKLEHSSAETIWMTQKALAMGNWWLAASSQQCACSCITSHAECFGKTSNHTGDWAPLQPRFGTLQLLDFPKLKSSLKGKRFQTIDEIQENTKGQLMAIRRTMWGPKVPTWKGTKVSLSYIQGLLYLVSSSTNASIFHSTWLHTFCTDLVYWPGGYNKKIHIVLKYMLFFCFIYFSPKNKEQVVWLVIFQLKQIFYVLTEHFVFKNKVAILYQ